MEVEDTHVRDLPYNDGDTSCANKVINNTSAAGDSREVLIHGSIEKVSDSRVSDVTNSSLEKESCNLDLQNLSAAANDGDTVLNESDRFYATDQDSDRLTETSLLDSSTHSSTDRSSDDLLYQTAEEDNATPGNEIHDATESPSSSDKQVSYGNREADGSQRNTQASRMSVDSLPLQGNADSLPIIIYEREERMSVDSVSEDTGDTKRSNRMSVECSSVDMNEHRRTERMSIDSSPRHKRLIEIASEVEKYIHDNRHEEAKKLVREQYVILEILQSHEEERNGVDMAEMYLLCAAYSLDCGLKKQAILSYYKGLLEMNDGEVQYMYHIQLVSEYWVNILTADVHLQEKIDICKELRTMADDRLRNSDGKKYNVPRAIYTDLCFYTFENLRKQYPKNKQIPEERLKAIVSVSKCHMQAGLYNVVATKICKPFVEHEYPDSAELYEVWARCLQALGNTDIAIKKAELALEAAQDQNHKASLQKFLAELKQDIQMKSQMAKDEQVDSDNEWLEGTNIHEPMKNVKTIENIKTSHVKKPKRRPKPRHPMDFFSNIKKSWNEIYSQHDQRNKAKSPLRPLNEDDQFPFRKKRRRRNTAGSEVSTTGCLHDQRLDDEEVLLPFCDSNDSGSDSEFFEFQNSFGDIVESEQSEDSDNDNECQTFYEKSIKENEDEENQQAQEIDMLTNGITLSPRFVKSKQIVDKKYHYSDSLPIESLKQLLLTDPKNYKKCQLQIEGAHTATCTVVSPDDDIKEIEICGRTKAGKNFTDDVVVVEILKHPSILNGRPDVIPRLNKVLSNQTDDHKAYGKVVGRLERRKFSNIDHPVFVCEMDEFEYNLMRPLCKTIPKIRIIQEHTESKFQIERYDYDSDTGELNFAELKKINPAQKRSFVFLVVYIRWDKVYPTGAVLKIIKSEGSLKKAMKIQEFLHQVPTTYLPKTLECVQNLVTECHKSALQSNKSDRLDLSDLSVFTIDPPESKDLDDALSVQRIENGCFCVGVHISDVTAFVKKDDDIDKEAQIRATTFYPGQGYKPFHMLPEPLSQDMCSLIPNENRLSLSIFLYMDENGMMLKGQSPVIRKTIIRSRRKFTYNEVQDIIMDKADNEFSDDLKLLLYLAKRYRTRRLGNAMHALPIETDASLYSDSVLKSAEAHYLVEEFMIHANGIAANFVCRHFPSCVPLRCQDAPSSDAVSHWLNNYPTIGDVILKIQGIKPLPDKQLAVKHAPKKRYRELIMIQKWTWEALETAVKEKDFGEAWKLVGSDELHPEQSLALAEWIRFQETAEYRCYGSSCSKKQQFHFSLNAYRYTHFTSPIRRYPDIIVHRLIHAALNSDNSPYTTEEVDELCHHINDVTKRAKAYGKQCSFIQMGEKFRKNPLMLHAFVEEVSDKSIIFHIPGMHKFPQSCKELPLQFLDVSRKPEITKDVDTDKDILTLQWQKRLYSHRGYSPSSRGYETKRLDPHMRTVFQQYNKWLEILKALFSNDHSLLRKIMDANGKHNDYSSQEMIRDWVPACTQTVKDVSSENRQGPITKHLTSFSMSFSHAQVIGVQLCAESRKGILVPFPQILDLTRNVKICLQHAMDPVKHLAKYGTTKSKGKHGKYSSCAEYMETWLPILQMESATAAAKEDSISIHDLPVRLDNRGGKFTLTLPFCEERNIKFPSMSMKLILKGEDDEENSHEIHYLSSSNFICVKYEMDVKTNEFSKGCPNGKRIWVGHGQIDKIKDKEKGRRDIYFTLNSGSPRPPVEATDGKKEKMSIEIMEKPKSNSRTESIVQCLEKSTNLAKAVAFGNRIPKLDNGHFELAKKSDCDIRAEDLVPNNPKQHEAIKKALTSSFSLIQGPPGTGKTYTGIKLVALFTQLNLKWKERGNDMKQVVFCGPSNKSVDLVAKWMIKKLGGRAPSIVRMYGSSLENVDYPVPGTVMSSKTRVDSRPDDKLREVSLHHLIRQRDKPYAEEIKQFDAEFRQVPNNMNREQTNEYKKKVRSYEKILSKASQEELKSHEVIFCTTAMATNPRFIRSIKDRVYQCIIDECGMCTEPECIATLIATKAKQVVLIGDHKQLRPVVLCSAAADLGLDKSLFERYSDSAIFLNKQYRMNPRICDFVSEQFYDRKLETGPSVAWKVDVPLSIWQFEHIPHIFCHVEGTEVFQTVATEEGSERSCSNKEEVEKVYHVFSRLIHTERVPCNQINIISQYNAQCHAIREYLRSKGFTTKEHGFSVNTVVASQGGEWDYVIFSTVRSLPDYKTEDKPTPGWCTKNLGFITDHNQINVALSRARKGLIIIGNKELLSCDTVWRNLLNHYSKRGCVLDAKTFPPRVHRRTQRSRSQASRVSRQTSAEFYKGTDMDIDV